MKIKLMIIGVLGALLLSSCGKPKPVAYGKADKSPYPTRECINELSHGAELKGPAIDRIVVYKGKRKMYAYANGKLVETFSMSLGKNGDKGNKVKAGDYRTPEGSYTIVRKNSDNRLYKSLMISYPNATDKARAEKME